MDAMAEELANLRADNANFKWLWRRRWLWLGPLTLSRSQRVQPFEDQFSSPAEKHAMGFMVDLTFDDNASLKMAVEVLVLNPAQCSGMFIILLWILLSYCS